MTAWKSIERAVAALVGGVRAWNSEDDIDVIVTPEGPLDVEVGGWAIEVKNRKGITIAQCEEWLRHNEPKARGRGLQNALVVKRRAGRGVVTPFLAIFPLTGDIEGESNGAV